VSRSEPATPRRRSEARQRGEVATSSDLTGAAALCAGLAALAATGEAATRALAVGLRHGLAEAAGGTAPAWAALLRCIDLVARAAGPACAAAALGAAVAGGLQTGGLFSLAVVRPRAERLDPARGLRRLASPRRLADVGLAVTKAASIAWVGWELLRRAAPLASASPTLASRALLPALAGLALHTALALCVALALFGVLELLLARSHLERGLRMTRDEVLRERRDEEGDPRHRGERRRLHRALASAHPVRLATCVVVNPSHVAVAMRHDRGSDDPPVVLAKGRGEAAARLRAEARRRGVPIVRDVALARALDRLAEVGEAIPEELYEAAAAVLVHVHAMRGERP
jgi:type III secretion protein U